MLKIGLSGGIGCGKSEVVEIFKSLDVPILDADEIAHQLTTLGSPKLDEIKQVFGSHAINSDGNLNRKYIRSIIFNDCESRKRLNAILHPAIREVISQQLENIDGIYCVIVVPLLLEANMLDMVNSVIIVDCPQDVQIRRIVARDQCSEAEAKRIIASQANSQQRLAIADVIINNNQTLECLRQSIHSLHKKIMTKNKLK